MRKAHDVNPIDDNVTNRLMIHKYAPHVAHCKENAITVRLEVTAPIKRIQALIVSYIFIMIITEFFTGDVMGRNRMAIINKTEVIRATMVEAAIQGSARAPEMKM